MNQLQHKQQGLFLVTQVVLLSLYVDEIRHKTCYCFAFLHQQPAVGRFCFRKSSENHVMCSLFFDVRLEYWTLGVKNKYGMAMQWYFWPHAKNKSKSVWNGIFDINNFDEDIFRISKVYQSWGLGCSLWLVMLLLYVQNFCRAYSVFTHFKYRCICIIWTAHPRQSLPSPWILSNFTWPDLRSCCLSGLFTLHYFCSTCFDLYISSSPPLVVTRNECGARQDDLK